MNQATHTIIESLGVSLPPDSVTTEEVLAGCKRPFRFPLEKISGIQSRHVGGAGYFSIDLAKQATADCLRHSRYGPGDIDLILCCSISRFDGPDRFSFEPGTAVRLREHFGLDRALAFDITNACAGMFTGIYLTDAFLQTGACDRALIVSGEYITHLATTAQREIEGYMDPRIACLTLGDAGAAVILERSADPGVGFQKIDLRTFGRYSPYCIGRAAETGGWIMHTDSVNLADAAIKAGPPYALAMLEQAGWPPDSFQHMIPHQTSRMTLNSARREISARLDQPVFDKVNLVDNLAHRGNTASTSHFVALADQIRNGELAAGDKVMFSISASGLTVGVGLYTFDDLPDRLRRAEPPAAPPEPASHGDRSGAPHRFTGPRVQVEQWGTATAAALETNDTRQLLKQAAGDCLGKSAHQRQDIELLLYCGVYRSAYIMEPAYATLLAGDLELNASPSDLDTRHTFAFDILNGSVGFLSACYAAQQLMAANQCTTALVTTAETENNRADYPEELLGIREAAAAVLLRADPAAEQGFSSFYFQAHTADREAYTVYCDTRTENPRLHRAQDEDLEHRYLEHIRSDVHAFLAAEGLEPAQIDHIFPPQRSSDFITRLSEALAIPPDKFIDVAGAGPDLFTASFPFALAHARENGRVRPGDTGLVIAAGAGIQIGCAIYHF